MSSLPNNLELLYSTIGVQYSFDTLYKTRNLTYIPENCIFCGIKVDASENIYLTVPRWLPGVPATLVLLDKKTGTVSAWPSAEIQDSFDDPNDLMNVMSMLIDSKGRMWVLDVGRRNFAEEVVDGSAKMLIIDISTRKVISRYTFPENVASSKSSFLNDLVIDEVNEIAYIPNTSTGGIVIYDHKKGTSRLYLDDFSTGNEPDTVFEINGVNYGKDKITGKTDGIAIDPNFENVYYCALDGTKLYSIPSKYLQMFVNDPTISSNDIKKYVTSYGDKVAPTGGLQIIDNLLYFGALTQNSFYSWDYTTESKLTPENQKLIAQDKETINWVDTFAYQSFPSRGKYLYFVSNRLNLFLLNISGATMDFSGESGANINVYRYKVPAQKFKQGGDPATIAGVSIFGALIGIAIFGSIFRAFWKRKSNQTELV